MKVMARVDIVIPLYNKAACIGRAIRSILNQTMTDWRLIVVDDGSTDAGPDVVRTFDDPRIELIRQQNAGPGAARTAGIAKAAAKYIAFLDADDEWYPPYLAAALAPFEQCPEVAMVSTMYCLWPTRQDMTHHWAKRNVRPGPYALSGNEDAAWADFLLSFPHVWNSVLPASVIRRYDGFYDGDRCMLGEDTTFFLRVGMNERFVILPEIGACHHTEDSDLARKTVPPLPPFFAMPRIVLDYCPREKAALMSGVLDHMALRFAKARARVGRKSDARELLDRFPGARSYPREYARCRTAIAFGAWLRCWVWFRCFAGPPIRAAVKSMARTLHASHELTAPGEETG